MTMPGKIAFLKLCTYLTVIKKIVHLVFPDPAPSISSLFIQVLHSVLLPFSSQIPLVFLVLLLFVNCVLDVIALVGFKDRGCSSRSIM